MLYTINRRIGYRSLTRLCLRTVRQPFMGFVHGKLLGLSKKTGTPTGDTQRGSEQALKTGTIGHYRVSRHATNLLHASSKDWNAL